MKYIHCPICGDCVLLRNRVKPRKCECEASWGRYVNNIDAEYGGAAIPFGINNHAFRLAKDQVLFTFEGFFYNEQHISSENLTRVENMDHAG